MGSPAPRVDGTPWADVEWLASQQVVLCRPRLEDAEALFDLQSDPALWVDVPMAWRMSSVSAQREELRAVAEHWEEHGFGYWLVREAADGGTGGETGGALLGVAGLRWLFWRDAWVLNVLVRVAVAAQGRGLATAVLDHALVRVGEGLGTPVTAVVRTRPGNAAMAALAHRLGFHDAGTEEREAGTYRLLIRTIGEAVPGS